ncbi:hypothetical protein [Bifidobacterium sp. ESL0790]|uniref:hypothetical protein n=1 Tax=Bifidobacterium sp. ESL0790 TaxID=2983233 RepID=UPI0023F64694|nr:hypothetical protein [Bifidobacterium sp. ESL0790]WEV71775.1 hypothetical protein OZY47_04745 [Bifidobacterium sp. ESL0790]
MKNFFKGISISQIVAGALAAVTSFLLSAKIGIAGSVIGVAIGSIVSAVASQIYQNVLKESGKKLQSATPYGGDDDEETHAGADDRTRVIGSSAVGTLGGDETSGLAQLARGDKSDAKDKDKDAVGKDYGKTRVMPAVADGGKTTVMKPVGPGAKTKAGKAVQNRRGAAIAGKTNSEVQKRNKRIAIIIAVVSALVAVGITAGVIMLATKGQGTDDVVRNIVKAPTSQQQTPSDDSSKNGTYSDGSSNGTNGSSTNKQNDSSTSGTNGGTSSNGADSSTSGSGSSSTSGSGSTGTGSGSGSGSSGTGSGTSGSSGSTGTGSGTGSDGSSSGSTGSGSSSSGTGSGASGSVSK